MIISMINILVTLLVLEEGMSAIVLLGQANLLNSCFSQQFDENELLNVS